MYSKYFSTIFIHLCNSCTAPTMCQALFQGLVVHSWTKHTEFPVSPFPSVSYHKHSPIWNTYITDFCISSLLAHKWNFCKDTAATFWTQNHAVSLKFKIRAEKFRIRAENKSRYIKKWGHSPEKFYKFLCFYFAAWVREFLLKKNKRKGKSKGIFSESITYQAINIYFLILTLL